MIFLKVKFCVKYLDVRKITLFFMFIITTHTHTYYMYVYVHVWLHCCVSVSASARLFSCFIARIKLFVYKFCVVALRSRRVSTHVSFVFEESAELLVLLFFLNTLIQI